MNSSSIYSLTNEDGGYRVIQLSDAFMHKASWKLWNCTEQHISLKFLCIYKFFLLNSTFVALRRRKITRQTMKIGYLTNCRGTLSNRHRSYKCL